MSEPTLREAAQAVLKRWESPLWRQEVGTNELMKDLRAALATSPAAPVAVEPVLWVSPAQLKAMTDPDSHGWPPGGRYLPARKTMAGLFTEALHTATQLHQAVERAREADKATIGALEAKLAAAEKDAGRYRWQRLGRPFMITLEPPFEPTTYVMAKRIGAEWGPALDAGIDAAMAKEAAHGQPT